MPVIDGIRQMAMTATDIHPWVAIPGHFAYADWNVIPVSP